MVSLSPLIREHDHLEPTFQPLYHVVCGCSFLGPSGTKFPSSYAQTMAPGCSHIDTKDNSWATVNQFECVGSGNHA